MRYNIEREGTLTPRVGYTYFSQFVGHDRIPLDGRYLEPEQTANHRMPYSDRGHLYAGGPEQSPQLYHGLPGAKLFKIGSTKSIDYARDGQSTGNAAAQSAVLCQKPLRTSGLQRHTESGSRQ
jgi:hypothetical protein